MQKFHISAETAIEIKVLDGLLKRDFHKKSRFVEQTGFYITAISLVDTVHHLLQFTIEHQ